MLKIFYITSSLYIIAIMLRVFPRTREREKAWKFGGFCFFGSLPLGPIIALIAHGKATNFSKVRHFPRKPNRSCRIRPLNDRAFSISIARPVGEVLDADGVS